MMLFPWLSRQPFLIFSKPHFLNCLCDSVGLIYVIYVNLMTLLQLFVIEFKIYSHLYNNYLF